MSRIAQQTHTTIILLSWCHPNAAIIEYMDEGPMKTNWIHINQDVHSKYLHLCSIRHAPDD